MKKILSSELREQAGSNSFNRFDYQAHWIVYHMLSEYKKNSQFLIFCEYHDDMAKVTDLENPTCAEFFQIKTTEKYSKWTLSRLTSTSTKKSGGIKNSFLGFIFYNFMQFDSECSKCHFISNVEMELNIREWQAIIEDGKKLEKENSALYSEIRKLIRSEYSSMDEDEFNQIFDRFIQNTFVYHGGLSLENYDKVVAGEFFKMLENDDLYTSNSNKILRDIIEEVRKKSKTKIQVPISFSKLKEQKGISSDIFNSLKQSIKNVSSEKSDNELREFMEANGISKLRQKYLIRELINHRRNMLDINKTLYQDVVYEVVKIIDNVLKINYAKIDDLSYLLDEVKRACNDILRKYDFFSDALVEVIFYERLLSEDTTI